MWCISLNYDHSCKTEESVTVTSHLLKSVSSFRCDLIVRCILFLSVTSISCKDYVTIVLYFFLGNEMFLNLISWNFWKLNFFTDCFSLSFIPIFYICIVAWTSTCYPSGSV